MVHIGQSLDYTIATWEFKEDHWTEIGSAADGVLDILFYQGSFHFLTSNEDLIRLVPEGPSFRMVRYHVELRSSKPLDDDYEAQEGTMLRRYLVESTAGHLLFAVKKTHCSKRTVDIKVFRLC